MRLRSPIKRLGGKGHMTAKIIPFMPNCRQYVEVFGGAGHILFARKPAQVETFNDLDEALINFFKVIAHPKSFKKFQRRVEALPISRQLWIEYRDTWRQQKKKVEKAVRWFVVCRQSFGGFFGKSWGYASEASTRHMAMTCSSWIGAIQQLPQIHKRIQRVQIENNDWRCILTGHDAVSTLFYLDPPYIPDTRKAGGYIHEMTIEDHQELVQRIMSLRGQVVLSCYNHPIYSILEESPLWNRYQWNTVSWASAKTKVTGNQGKGSTKKKSPRVETLWVKQNEYKVKGFRI